MLQQHDAYINAFGIIIHISHTYYSYKYIYERIYDRCEVKGAIPAWTRYEQNLNVADLNDLTLN